MVVLGPVATSFNGPAGTSILPLADISITDADFGTPRNAANPWFVYNVKRLKLVNVRIGEKIMIAVRCGSFNNRVYLLQGMHQAGRAAIDSQLQGVLNSFRLVQQTTSSPRVEPEKQVLNLEQRAEVIGKVVGYLLGIGAVVWMWRRRSASAGD